MRLCLLALGLVALTALAGDAGPKVVHQVARYRLTPAKVSVNTPDGRMLEVQAVFKLDVQSGDTWIYKAQTSTSNLVEGWVKLPDLR